MRIKSKHQVLEILMEATRYMLSANRVKKLQANSGVILRVEKMSRIFFVDKNKYYSVIFPFNVYIDDNEELSFNFENIIDIDAQTISNIISVLKDSKFNSLSSYDFAESIFDFENNFNENFWSLIKGLLLMEDGYVRYDKDEEGYQKAKEQKQEHRHPLDHLDIFYTNKNSFKIGLDTGFLLNDFIDSLNLNTDCRYLRLP